MALIRFGNFNSFKSFQGALSSLLIMKKPQKDHDLLAKVSYEKSLELIACQIISELITEDDPPYEEINDRETKSYENPSFGKLDCPVDQNAFYESICYWFIRIHSQQKDPGKGMSVATIRTIYLFSRKADPLNYANPQKLLKDNSFIEYLIALKKHITDYAKLVELIDISISTFPEILRIGNSEKDFYKNAQEFKKNVNVVEIMAIVNLALEYCCQEEKMKLVSKFLIEGRY